MALWIFVEMFLNGAKIGFMRNTMRIRQNETQRDPKRVILKWYEEDLGDIIGITLAVLYEVGYIPIIGEKISVFVVCSQDNPNLLDSSLLVF